MSKRYELGVFVRVYWDIDSFDSYEQVRDRRRSTATVFNQQTQSGSITLRLQS